MVSADDALKARPERPPMFWSIIDYALGLRDRLLTRPWFISWASRFPLTRPIARHRTQELFDLCAGFVYSQILSACVQLHLFDTLAEGPQTADQLAARLSLDPRRLTQLLEAAASLRLAARRRGNRYGLGALGAAIVANPGIARMIDHHALLYDDLRDPLALLRGTGAATSLGQYWAYAQSRDPGDLNGAQIGSYTALMAASQPMIAEEVLSAYSFHRHRAVMDVGGGNGAFLTAAARKLKNQTLMLFDLPAVADQAAARFADEGIGSRITITPGNFFADPLPSGAGAITLLRVLHDHDDDKALYLLKAICQALPPDGILILAEPMAGTKNAESVAAYFGFYLLAMGSGRPRREDEITTLLHQAGFRKVLGLPTRNPLLVKILAAEP